MSPAVRAAIDAARDITQTRQFLTQPRRLYSFEHVHYLVLAVLKRRGFVVSIRVEY